MDWDEGWKMSRLLETHKTWRNTRRASKKIHCEVVGVNPSEGTTPWELRRRENWRKKVWIACVASDWILMPTRVTLCGLSRWQEVPLLLWKQHSTHKISPNFITYHPEYKAYILNTRRLHTTTLMISQNIVLIFWAAMVTIELSKKVPKCVEIRNQPN